MNRKKSTKSAGKSRTRAAKPKRGSMERSAQEMKDHDRS
jgi:hypothetical protein